MLRIGEFSELSSISIHMLRNYDKIGLLVPKKIDEDSGYRYYDKEQLVQANQILALKSMGFGLEEIKIIMQKQKGEINDFLQAKLEEQLREIERIKEQVKLINSVLHGDDRKDCSMLSIAQKKIEPMWVVSYRGSIGAYQEEGLLWKRLNGECEKSGIPIPPNSPAMAIYHDINEDNILDVEVQLRLNKEYKPKGSIKVTEYPEREVVSVIFKGSYQQFPSINKMVAEWLEKNELKINGLKFTIYHNSPGNCTDDKDFITEICFPVQKK